MVTGPRRSVRAVKRRRVHSAQVTHGTVPGTRGRSELDTRADTSCAGANFKLHELTGQTCSVSPFSDKYDPLTDVPIATCLTAYTNEYGRTFILVFHEMLWFGDGMDHSLINPNQIRLTGTPVSDDPFDDTRRLGIDHPTSFVPFETNGTCIYFDTHVPTESEILHCSHVVMTEDTEWDPSSVRFQQVRTKEEEGFRKIAQIARTETEPYDVMSEQVLGGISNLFVERALTKRPIASVNIKDVSPIVTARPINEGHFTSQWERNIREVKSRTRHSATTPEDVARKFGCGIVTAKETLRVTTQQGVRHAIHPLHRRYRVDNMQFNRQRLNSQFYVDHLIAKPKSLEGNTGAWVYTTSNFTAVYPVEKRSEAGDTLRRLSDDVGIPDRLRADLAGEITGNNTEFQKQVRKLHIVKSSPMGTDS